jgi:MFS family permease
MPPPIAPGPVSTLPSDGMQLPFPPPMVGAPHEGEQAWLAPFRATKPSRLSDPLVKTSWVELGIGGVAVLVGSILWGAGSVPEETTCGIIAGCFDAPTKSSEGIYAGGAALTGFGLGMVATSALTLVITAARPLREGEMRKLDAMAIIGHLAVATSVASLTSGLVYGRGGDRRGELRYGLAWPAYLVSGITASVGIPLVAIGGQITSRDDRTVRRSRHAERDQEQHEIPTDITVGAGRASVTWQF